MLYDTTVYIDILQGRFPQQGELAATCGLLDPAHSQTPGIIAQIVAVIDRRPIDRTIIPDLGIWRCAA